MLARPKQHRALKGPRMGETYLMFVTFVTPFTSANDVTTPNKIRHMGRDLDDRRENSANRLKALNIGTIATVMWIKYLLQRTLSLRKI